MTAKRTSVGMFGHTFEADGSIAKQFEIVREGQHGFIVLEVGDGCSEKVDGSFRRGRVPEGNARRRRIVSYDNCQRGDPMSSAARHRKADR